MLICFAVNNPSSLLNAKDKVRFRKPVYCNFTDLPLVAARNPVCLPSSSSSDEALTPRRQYIPNAPIFLVGLKSDLRGDVALERKLKERGEAFVTEAEATKLVKEIKAHAYKVRLHHIACVGFCLLTIYAGVLGEDSEGSP